MRTQQYIMHHRIILQLTLLSFIYCSLISALSPTDVDYDIVYKCFYDHIWLWDKTDHCHVVAYGGGKQSFTARELKQRAMFQEMIQADRKDRQLVRHCFLYHQFDLNFERCRGISWDRPKNAEYRQARLVRLWGMSAKEQRRKIAWARAFDDPDEALIETCLYTIEWLSKPEHLCHQVVYAGGLKSHFDEHDQKLQRMYRERRFHDQVADCFYNHRHDQYGKCYDITWSVGRLQRNDLVNRIWQQLESASAHTTPQQ